LEKLFVFSPEKSFENHMTCFPMGFSEGNTTWRQQCKEVDDKVEIEVAENGKAKYEVKYEDVDR
jgi:hypothetical protein